MNHLKISELEFLSKVHLMLVVAGTIPHTLCYRDFVNIYLGIGQYEVDSVYVETIKEMVKY